MRDETVSFSAMYSRDFRLFWASQAISFAGTWMQATAQGWLVYSLTKSPYYLGIVAAAASLPILLFTLIGGAVADRMNKRRLLVLTQALSIVPAVTLGILTELEIVRVWHVIAMALLLGTINAIDVPARQSFLIEMVERGHLTTAIALNSAAFNGARIIGPVAAGITIAHFTMPVCFYLNAASFVPLVLALMLMKTRGVAGSGSHRMLTEIAEGVRFIRHRPEVMMPLLIVAAISLFGMPFASLLPVFADAILHVGPKGLGFLSGAAGLGAFIAAVFIAFRGDIRDKWPAMRICATVFPLSLFAFTFSQSYALSLSILVILGASLVGYLSLANSSIQMASPDALRGRVMSVYSLVFLGFTPIGNYIIGTSADIIGTIPTVRIGSAVCLTLSLYILSQVRRD